MANEITVVLNNGRRVLGKLYKGAPVAKTFANRTQAQAAATKTGGDVRAFGRPFYVVIEDRGSDTYAAMNHWPPARGFGGIEI